MKNTNTSTIIQQALILEILKVGPTTTTDFREKHKIYNPSARISELRRLGHTINKTLVNVIDENGAKHIRVARYTLAAPPSGN